MDSVSSVAEAWSRCLEGRPSIAIGSGTWGLACLFNALAEIYPQRRVMLPAFLCHNPLSAALYAGWTPVFCDVDPATGVPAARDLDAALEQGVDVVLAVHLFGQAIDIHGLAEKCASRGVFLVEDACQAVGATIGDQYCGSFGDASVASFGYSKQVDAGGGAVIASEDTALLGRIGELDRARSAALTGPERAGRSNDFSRAFYAAKAAYEGGEANAFLGLAETYLPLVPSVWEGSVPMAIRGLQNLVSLAQERRRKYSRYVQLFEGSGLEVVPTDAGASPWRFCFRLPGATRERQVEFSETVRRKGVNVSNWYLPCNAMTSLPAASMPGTERLSAEICQLWLDESTDNEQIAEAARAVRESLQ